MKFGKLLKQRMRPGWNDEYINYYRLKNLLKERNGQIVFQEELLLELNKIVSFGNSLKVKLTKSMKHLQRDMERLKCWKDSSFPDLEENVEATMSKALIIGNEFRWLVDYIDLNVEAVMKLLKKKDKIIGQYTGPSLLEKFQETHLDVFMDIKEAIKQVEEIESALKILDDLKNTGKDSLEDFVGMNSRYRSSRTLFLG